MNLDNPFQFMVVVTVIILIASSIWIMTAPVNAIKYGVYALWAGIVLFCIWAWAAVFILFSMAQ